MQKLNLITFALLMFILSVNAATPRSLKQAKIRHGDDHGWRQHHHQPKPSK